MYKISIIVPVYNSAVYLRQCLDSLISQTLKDIEIICSYDKSTDDSLKILHEYAEKDNRIVILVLDENKRLGAARNAALKRARGEYIGFVDSDDWIELDMYEKLLSASATEEADMVTVTKHFKDRNNQRIVERHIPLPICSLDRDGFNKYICRELSAPLWMNIVKKSLFFDNQLFFAENLQHEDVPIAHALYCTAEKVAVVDAAFYHYRDNLASITSRPSENRFDLLATCVMYLDNMKRLGLYEKYKDECDYWFYTRYYCRMLATCFLSFSSVRKDYIRIIKESFPRYVNIYSNKYYILRKKTRFDIFLWILNKSTNIACFLFYILKYSKVIIILKRLKEIRRFRIQKG
jgi:glycosyltransferase involved in cell wall biosynthesis